MQAILKELTRNMNFTHDLKQDIQLFLISNHCPKTAEHCMEVGTEARRVATLFNADPDEAEIGGWLHDISAVIPNNERIAAAKELQIDILAEEEAFPMIIHQKISKVMAKEIFKITNAEILDAVGCHTTLRRNSSKLDQVLFVADKIAWDQSGIPPYIQELHRNLEVSLTYGAFSYINYLWERKESLKVIHPWLRDAYEELNDLLKPQRT
ncbi:putative HD superfamily hydrolase of NAD metabolism [Paenibacillus uliginis N3/975]|uniref:Putative HD superfamily hydrolase of NAD metabolism n=1 Tax=Paenibacillus uliginis N3/975 TaxID=1313296 RepID=A0A1X7H6E9_9BACL|nr:bis(5'-nucleosyl)-tetraphosphatase (symmetrical) YqeK [Paenibacillus uliginis]SMF79953.1 putative HD superfamily hydrolase of NAD metabolism [Paenibacillus uliginis N3/975]